MSTVGNWQGPKIIKDGLISYIDPASRSSYFLKNGTFVADLSGFNNRGPLVNGIGFVDINEGVFSFDGVNDYLSIASGTLGTNWTMSCWFNVNALTFPEGLVNVFSSTGGSGWYVSSLFGGSTNRYIGWYLDGNWRNSSAGVWTTNTWYNLVARVSGNTYTYHVNGVQRLSYTSPNNSTNNIIGSIGRLHNYNGRYFPGYIGQFLAYNRPLTDTEILYNYDLIKGRFGL